MNTAVSKIISKVILAEKPVKIKLLGDSITQGVGGTGFDPSGEEFVEGFPCNNDGYCRENLFKNHMEQYYDFVVVNFPATSGNELIKSEKYRRIF